MPGRVSWLRCCAPRSTGTRLNTVITARERIATPWVTGSPACLPGRLRPSGIQGVAMRSRAVMTVLSLVPVLLGAQQRSQDTRPGIAVFPFNNGGSYGQGKEDFDALERGIAGMMISELAQNPAARVVERQEIQRLRDEQNLTAPNRGDPQTAA